MKKIIAVALFFTVVISFVACGSEVRENPTVTEPETESNFAHDTTTTENTTVISPETTDIPEEMPEDSISNDTDEIMQTYNFGDVQAEISNDENYNIYINFTPDVEDKRILVKPSSEGEIEWLISYESNMDLNIVRDLITEKDYYCLYFSYAGAPYNGNNLYFFDAEQEMLIDSLTNYNTSEVIAEIIKKGEGYNVSIPEYGIEQDIEFSSYIGDGWLMELRGEEEWDEFTIDYLTLHLKNIDFVNFTDYTISIERVVFTSERNEDWLPDFRIEIIYEIQNGALIPTKYQFAQ